MWLLNEVLYSVKAPCFFPLFCAKIVVIALQGDYEAALNIYDTEVNPRVTSIIFLFFAKFLSPLEDVFITAGMIIVRFCKPTNSNKIAFVLFAVKLHDIPYLQMLPRFKASATFPLTDGSSLLYRLKFEG